MVDGHHSFSLSIGGCEVCLNPLKFIENIINEALMERDTGCVCFLLNFCIIDFGISKVGPMVLLMICSHPL